MSAPTNIEREHYAKLVGPQITAIQWEEIEGQALPVLVLSGWPVQCGRRADGEKIRRLRVGLFLATARDFAPRALDNGRTTLALVFLGAASARPACSQAASTSRREAASSLGKKE